MSKDNIGESVLILGVIYLHLVYELNLAVTVILGVLAVATWSYHAWTNERKQGLLAEIELLEAKKDWYARRKK